MLSHKKYCKKEQKFNLKLTEKRSSPKLTKTDMKDLEMD